MNWRDATDGLLLPLLRAHRLGLVTDMDGTLSPIVPNPEAARITPENQRLLTGLAQQLPLVAVVSGRGAADLWQRVRQAGLTYVGNHGLEQWEADQAVLLPEVQAYRPALLDIVSQLESTLPAGMWTEDKGASLAIHYRQAGDIDLAPVRARIAALAAHHRLTLFEGRKVFEIRPPIPVNKGIVLERLVTTAQLNAVVFMGDDTTDADALQTARQLRATNRCYAVGLGVASPETPAVVYENADLLLDGIPDVESFLAWLLRSLNASSN